MKALIAICLLAIAGCRAKPLAPVELDGQAMGGTWSVKIDALDPARATEIRKGVGAVLEKLEQQMSSYRLDSEVCRFNATRSTDWVAVPPELAEVVSVAQEVSAASGGAFDITVARLVNLWGFGPEPRGVRLGVIPTDAEIEAAQRHVGYAKLDCRLDPPALRKSDPLLSIDLGAIGKGFAADKVGVYLDSMDVKDYLIAVGGELRAKGRPRTVGIETPTPDVRRILESLELEDSSLSTSGDYRNFVDVNGKRYCHEIDHHTGRPITGNLASVSVHNPSGTRADAWATALIVAGEGGESLAEKTGVEAIFVFRGNGHFDVKRTSASRIRKL